jgi:hypothetical protein
MATTGKILLFATALVLALSSTQSIAQIGQNEKWLRGTSGKVSATRQGPGVLKSTDQGRTWARTKTPKITGQCLTPDGRRTAC